MKRDSEEKYGKTMTGQEMKVKKDRQRNKKEKKK